MAHAATEGLVHRKGAHAHHTQTRPEHSYEDRKKRDTGSWWTLPLTAGLYLLAMGLAYHFGNRQVSLKLAADTPGTEFCEERAWQHISHLTNLGVRMTGSHQNEVLAAGYILKELETIQRTAPLVGLTMEIDVQRPSGCFNMFFVGFNYTNCYQNVTNIVARLSASDPAKGTTRNALMINAHFDTPAGSPGASDDTAGIGIMLELVRVLAHRAPLGHAVVFLFNGAEESYLQASHGFITQHKWAGTLRAFINLEAAGSGGRELVFQTGPGHSWLVNAYARAAPYPHASVVAEEIFQSGAIPGDTDFRVFRDYGGLPGIDIAYVANGYAYHTMLDNLDNIDAGAVQRCGDNVLATLVAITNSKALSEPFAHSQEHAVYYDVMGLFTVVYSASLATAINTVAAVLVAAALTLTGAWQWATLRAAWALLLGWLAALATCVLMGTLLQLMGKTLVWYAQPWLLLGLYAAPAALTMTSVVRRTALQGDRQGAEQASFHAAAVLWLQLLVLGTYLHLGSAYMPLHWAVWPVALRTFLPASSARQRTVHMVAGCVVPCALGGQLVLLLFKVFVPVLGRSGTEAPPDVIVGVMVFASLCLTTPYLVGVAHVDSRWKDRTAPMLMAVTLACWGCAMVSFPYTASRPHRVIVQHTMREIMPPPGSNPNTQPAVDYGYWLVPFDYNARAYISRHAPPVIGAVNYDAETAHLGYLVPWYLPLDAMFTKHMYVSGPRPMLPPPLLDGTQPTVGPGQTLVRTAEGPVIVHSSITKPCEHDERLTCRRVSVRAHGPCHMTLVLSKGRSYSAADPSSMSIKAWSFGPMFHHTSKPFFFIYTAAGHDPMVWDWWVEVLAGHELQFTLNGHYGPTLGFEPDIGPLRATMPDWISLTPWTSHLANYTL